MDVSISYYLIGLDQTVGCGVGLIGVFFFISFILIVTLIFLNLFIAIILQGFEDINDKEKKVLNNDVTD